MRRKLAGAEVLQSISFDRKPSTSALDFQFGGNASQHSQPLPSGRLPSSRVVTKIATAGRLGISTVRPPAINTIMVRMGMAW
jgi:hypothetical protein